MIRTLALVILSSACVAAQQTYKTPPKPLLDAATAKRAPTPSIAPGARHVVLVTREAMPDIQQLARRVLRLAGRRIDPASHGPQLTGGRAYGLSILRVADGTTRRVALPPDANVGSITWTADGSKFAFTNTRNDGIYAWVADVATGKAVRATSRKLNTTTGSGIRWMPDGKRLLCTLWPQNAGAAPTERRAPKGPAIQESDGMRAPVRTFQDLLTNSHDADLFEYHTRSELAVVDPRDGSVQTLGDPATFAGASVSPDGDHVLVTRVVRPYSFIVTWWSFPRVVEVRDMSGHVERVIARMPMADKVPIGGVQTGPRSVRWKISEPATLVWVEALDDGDPKATVPHRDRVVQLDLREGDADPEEWFRTEYRFRSLQIDDKGELAFVETYDRPRRWMRIWRRSATDTSKPAELWHERAARDAYADPGTPVQRSDAAGFSRVRRNGSAVFLRGGGASPEGARPFLDRLDLVSGAKTRLFHSGKDEYASVVAMLDDDGNRLLISRESKTDSPELWIVDGETRSQLTKFGDEQAELIKGIAKRLLRYKRDDGIDLSGTLYTPPYWDGSTRLPLLVWAYPREYVSTKTAGQVRTSQHRYTRLSSTSPLMMLLAGYAVLDGATMPIVGPKESANDNFVKQLVASAQAAIDAAVEAGVADRSRCAIAGHSYGAFMTANLLAHSDLFRAGIARSGAYNRTLTPFGFQNERRTYWEAPQIYFSMSPFMHAQKINEPILLIHGMLDNNSGTFPIQSKRLFHAIKGNGGRARLVFLPHESHGYRARESILHVLAESVDWLDAHVKNAAVGVTPASSERK